MNSGYLISAHRLHRTYTLGKVAVRVLRGATLNVNKGEFVVIMGASGSGKSTLLHLLGALDTPDSGGVTFLSRNIFAGGPRARDRYRNNEVGFVFQFYHLLPELNVLENVLMPRMVHDSVRSWLVNRSQARRKAKELLDRVGLADRARHRPRELSGGERQRVAIARALINSPRLLLADEPTGNLDAVIGGQILDLLRQFNEDGQTIIMVTHDPAVAQAASRRVELVDGAIRGPGG